MSSSSNSTLLRRIFETLLCWLLLYALACFLQASPNVLKVQYRQSTQKFLIHVSTRPEVCLVCSACASASSALAEVQTARPKPLKGCHVARWCGARGGLRPRGISERLGVTA